MTFERDLTSQQRIPVPSADAASIPPRVSVTYDSEAETFTIEVDTFAIGNSSSNNSVFGGRTLLATVEDYDDRLPLVFSSSYAPVRISLAIDGTSAFAGGSINGVYLRWFGDATSEDDATNSRKWYGTPDRTSNVFAYVDLEADGTYTITNPMLEPMLNDYAMNRAPYLTYVNDTLTLYGADDRINAAGPLTRTVSGHPVDKKVYIGWPTGDVYGELILEGEEGSYESAMEIGRIKTRTTGLASALWTDFPTLIPHIGHEGDSMNIYTYKLPPNDEDEYRIYFLLFRGGLLIRLVKYDEDGIPIQDQQI